MDDQQIEALTEEEKRLLGLFVRGLTADEIASELTISPEAVRECMQMIMVKLHLHERLSPDPDLPPAASAALAVPIQQAEDVPKHIGKPLRRKDD